MDRKLDKLLLLGVLLVDLTLLMVLRREHSETILHGLEGLMSLVFHHCLLVPRLYKGRLAICCKS